MTLDAGNDASSTSRWAGSAQRGGLCAAGLPGRMIPPHPDIPAAPPAPRVPIRVRLRASFSQSGRTLGLVWRSSPRGTLALGALTLAAAALPPFVAWVGKLIIDAVMATHAAAPGAARD